MKTNERAKLLEALQTGQVTVTFKKIDTGEIRVMPCTLNVDILNDNGLFNHFQGKNVDEHSSRKESLQAIGGVGGW